MDHQSGTSVNIWAFCLLSEMFSFSFNSYINCSQSAQESTPLKDGCSRASDIFLASCLLASDIFRFP